MKEVQLITGMTAISPVPVIGTARAIAMQRFSLVRTPVELTVELTGAKPASVLAVLVTAGPGLTPAIDHPFTLMPRGRYKVPGPYNTSARVGSLSLLIVY